MTDPIARAVAQLAREEPDPAWSKMRRPPEDVAARDAAVLMLFGKGTLPVTEAGRRRRDSMPDESADADVLLLQRAHGLRHHAGQVAFPGGGIDSDDGGPVAAALREAEEETGVEPDGVDVLGTLTPLFIPPSKYLVTPVLGWWREEKAVHVVDSSESASVVRVAAADLVCPANRGVYRHNEYSSPAFDVDGLVVWGFTALLLDFAFDRLGWDAGWDRRRLIGPEE